MVETFETFNRVSFVVLFGTKDGRSVGRRASASGWRSSAAPPAAASGRRSGGAAGAPPPATTRCRRRRSASTSADGSSSTPLAERTRACTGAPPSRRRRLLPPCPTPVISRCVVFFCHVVPVAVVRCEIAKRDKPNRQPSSTVQVLQRLQEGEDEKEEEASGDRFEFLSSSTPASTFDGPLIYVVVRGACRVFIRFLFLRPHRWLGLCRKEKTNSKKKTLQRSPLLV